MWSFFIIILIFAYDNVAGVVLLDLLVTLLDLLVTWKSEDGWVGGRHLHSWPRSQVLSLVAIRVYFLFKKDP